MTLSGYFMTKSVVKIDEFSVFPTLLYLRKFRK